METEALMQEVTGRSGYSPSELHEDEMSAPLLPSSSSNSSSTGLEQLSKTNLYIRGLPPATTDLDLVKLCHQYGKIQSAKAILDKTTNKCKGYGFVDFDSPAAALKAVHALKTSGIQAQMAKTRSGVPAAQLCGAAHTRACAATDDGSLSGDLRGNKQATAQFVWRGSHGDAALLPFLDEAVEALGCCTVQIKCVCVCVKQQQEQDPTNLYISNLPLSVDEKELEKMLQPFGQVVSTRILRDYSGNSRGVGFARMDTTEQCNAVISHFNGKFIKLASGAPSQPLLCKFADSQRKKHAHSGYVPNGQTTDLRLGAMTLTYDPSSAAIQNGYYPSPYPVTNRIMTVQPTMSPYMSPVSAYQLIELVKLSSCDNLDGLVLQAAVMSPSVDPSMSLHPSTMITQQMGQLALGNSGAYIAANPSVQGAYMPPYPPMQAAPPRSLHTPV
ncbi:unnamed protein product [Menidia menidia]|uniref:(Atlantic silverside) hypothetical protein n=1 Tax=Menidia menidia TaxID=238744 RepID=A0A8S4ACW9_9TELE|nr:unnamed protein product [Menidia menidia]